MELLGQPFVIQNTNGPNWLVTWHNAVHITNEHQETLESITFTVAIPRRAQLTIEDLQRHALKRAQELLQDRIRQTPA